MMFNEYLDHSNQCGNYYSVVRKEEINLQQNDTTRFKQKWLEVSGCYNNNTTSNTQPIDNNKKPFSTNINTKHELVNSSNSSTASSTSSSSSSPSPSTQQQYQYYNNQAFMQTSTYSSSSSNSNNKNGATNHYFDPSNTSSTSTINSVTNNPGQQVTPMQQQTKFYDQQQQQHLVKQHSLNNLNGYANTNNSANLYDNNSTSKFNQKSTMNVPSHPQMYNQQQAANQYNNQFQMHQQPNQLHHQQQHNFNQTNHNTYPTHPTNQYQTQDYSFDTHNSAKLEQSNLSPTNLNKKLSSSSLSVQQQQFQSIKSPNDKSLVKDNLVKSPQRLTSPPTQKTLIDLNQEQLINDDCDSARGSLLSPILKSNFVETSNQTKSILNEINIDELFIYYPNVFEELFYSANNPFKLNSIEQIEHDLRTYCEQQFKLNLNNQTNSKDNSTSNNNATNQQFSIRI